MIRFAIIGCGHIGKRHAEMVTRHPEAELVALIDQKPRELLGLDAHDAPFFDSLDAFFESKTAADVVCICTPNGWHTAHALACLKHGLHVVIEKPMALRRADAEKVISTALQAQRQVFCVMQNRYSPPAVWLKDLVSRGVLGRIFLVQVNCYWNRDERYYKRGGWHGTKDLDGGTLFTQFSHFIDMLYWLFGDIQQIEARFSDFNHADLTEFEDSGVVRFSFVDGEGLGSLQFSTAVWNQNMESSVTVIAEHGSVKIGGQYMNEVEYCHVKDYKMPLLQETNPGNDYGAYKGSAQNHHHVIENVVDVLQGRAAITTNALEGLKVVDIIERIYAAGQQP